MEWLSEYDKTRRSSWTFVSFSGLTLLLKDELSFAVLYAECSVDGLSVDPEKVIDAAAFDFSKDEKVSFRCESELSSGQKRITNEICSVSDFELRCVFTDYTAELCLSTRFGSKVTRPEYLCLDVAKVLVSKNEITGGTAMTRKEKELLPAAYAIRFLMQAASGVSLKLKDGFYEMMKPVLDEFPDAEYVAELLKLEKKADPKKEKSLNNRFAQIALSYDGHIFFSELMRRFSDATASLEEPRGRKARERLSEKLHDLGYSGVYPYFRKEKDGIFRYMAFAEYRRIKDGKDGLRALLRCGAMQASRDGTAYGVPFEKSRIYDTAFVSEGRNISLETLDLDGATPEFINETLETADRLFDGVKIPRVYAKTHTHLRTSYKRSVFQSFWTALLVFIVSGALISSVLTAVIAGIATGIAAVYSAVSGDSGYLGWFIWARGSWLDVGLIIFPIAGFICAKSVRSSMTRPLKIRRRKKNNKAK